MKSYLLLSLAGFCFLSAAPALRAQSLGSTSPLSTHKAHKPHEVTKPVQPTVAKPADLPPGTVEGTYTTTGKKPVNMSYVTAFIDKQDARHPTIIILADHRVPLDHWNDEVPSLGPDANALVFWLDKGNFYRTDEFWHGVRKSTSGIYALKLASLTSNDLSGSGSTPNSSDRAKLDVRLHVIVPQATGATH